MISNNYYQVFKKGEFPSNETGLPKSLEVAASDQVEVRIDHRIINIAEEQGHRFWSKKEAKSSFIYKELLDSFTAGSMLDIYVDSLRYPYGDALTFDDCFGSDFMELHCTGVVEVEGVDFRSNSFLNQKLLVRIDHRIINIAEEQGHRFWSKKEAKSSFIYKELLDSFAAGSMLDIYVDSLRYPYGDALTFDDCFGSDFMELHCIGAVEVKGVDFRQGSKGQRFVDYRTSKRAQVCIDHRIINIAEEQGHRFWRKKEAKSSFIYKELLDSFAAGSMLDIYVDSLRYPYGDALTFDDCFGSDFMELHCTGVVEVEGVDFRQGSKGQRFVDYRTSKRAQVRIDHRIINIAEEQGHRFWSKKEAKSSLIYKELLDSFAAGSMLDIYVDSLRYPYGDALTFDDCFGSDFMELHCTGVVEVEGVDFRQGSKGQHFVDYQTSKRAQVRIDHKIINIAEEQGHRFWSKKEAKSSFIYKELLDSFAAGSMLDIYVDSLRYPYGDALTFDDCFGSDFMELHCTGAVEVKGVDFRQGSKGQRFVDYRTSKRAQVCIDHRIINIAEEQGHRFWRKKEAKSSFIYKELLDSFAAGSMLDIYVDSLRYPYGDALTFDDCFGSDFMELHCTGVVEVEGVDFRQGSKGQRFVDYRTSKRAQVRIDHRIINIAEEQGHRFWSKKEAKSSLIYKELLDSFTAGSMLDIYVDSLRYPYGDALTFDDCFGSDFMELHCTGVVEVEGVDFRQGSKGQHFVDYQTSKRAQVRIDHKIINIAEEQGHRFWSKKEAKSSFIYKELLDSFAAGSMLDIYVDSLRYPCSDALTFDDCFGSDFMELHCTGVVEVEGVDFRQGSKGQRFVDYRTSKRAQVRIDHRIINITEEQGYRFWSKKEAKSSFIYKELLDSFAAGSMLDIYVDSLRYPYGNALTFDDCFGSDFMELHFTGVVETLVFGEGIARQGSKGQRFVDYRTSKRAQVRIDHRIINIAEEQGHRFWSKKEAKSSFIYMGLLDSFTAGSMLDIYVDSLHYPYGDALTFDDCFGSDFMELYCTGVVEVEGVDFRSNRFFEPEVVRIDHRIINIAEEQGHRFWSKKEAKSSFIYKELLDSFAAGSMLDICVDTFRYFCGDALTFVDCFGSDFMELHCTGVVEVEGVDFRSNSFFEPEVVIAEEFEFRNDRLWCLAKA
ncbi:hypothetical protein LWI29_020341 [Acer saccharum]|uniref:Uncharacterized protein n=1 Tax=Acer saccharum TaxID=4024 RepID=A0AA39RS26_ACESA|nr:hypothetical protein LWI29_020341 [Acer saccharum]